MSINIILADDHHVVRQGLRSLLEKELDLQVVGETDNGRAAIQIAKEIIPDVVIMDITMPDLNGIEACRHIAAKTPEARVLILSMHSDKRFVMKALNAGASGYLLKDCVHEELVAAIHVVANGHTYVSPQIADVVIRDYIHNLPADVISPKSILTTREREVLQLIAEGKTTKEIASDLSVSVKTIETHRQEVMNRLKIYSVAKLTKYAIREGLTSVD